MAVAFKSSYQNITLTEFPISKTETATLELVPAHSVIDANTEWYVGSKRVELPDVVAYRGVIVGEPNSKVLLNYANGDLMGTVIRAGGEQLAISPYGSSKEDNRSHTIAPESFIAQLNGNTSFNCGTDEVSPLMSVLPPESEINKSGAQTLSTKPLEVQVIVESTTGFYIGPGRNDADKAGAYIVALYNMVSMIYEDEMNLTYRLVKVQIWTTDEPDNYKNSNPNSGDNASLKDECVARWKNRSDQRDLVNLLSRLGGTSILGIANGIGGICNNTDSYRSAYAVCGIQSYSELPTLSYNGEVVTIAHENGHVFGALHTHNCFWNPPLDSCTSSGNAYISTSKYSDACNEGAPVNNKGSIMSYCHLWGNGVPMTFLPRVYNYLRKNLEGKACVTELATSTLKVQYPIGNQSFKAGSDTVIRWTASTNITNVKIEFSPDNGATWQVIPGGESVNSKLGGRAYGQGIIAWKVPEINTDNALIRVSDAANTATWSTTLAPFSIQIAALTLEYPKGGEKFGQKEKLTIEWAATLVNIAKVEFSSDGGATWIELTSSGIGTLSYDLPDIETSQALIRISDTSNNKIVSQSGVFAIGIEKIVLIAPNGNELICADSNFNITWSTDFMGVTNSRVKIQYSTDDGVSWKNITNSIGVNANTGSYTWSGEKTPSALARVRIVYRNDSSLTANSKNVFKVDPCIVGVDESIQKTTFTTLAVSPNPISTQGVAIVEFPDPCAQIECTLIDTKGAVVAVLGNFDNFTEGKHELRFDVSTIASGSYFITLRCGAQRISAPLTIFR